MNIEELLDNSSSMDPAERFSLRVNIAMQLAIQEGADRLTLAKIAENTSREIWQHYGAREASKHQSYLHFVTDVGFETAELEDWLDTVESAGLDPDEFMDDEEK